MYSDSHFSIGWFSCQCEDANLAELVLVALGRWPTCSPLVQPLNTMPLCLPKLWPLKLHFLVTKDTLDLKIDKFVIFESYITHCRPGWYVASARPLRNPGRAVAQRRLSRCSTHMAYFAFSHFFSDVADLFVLRIPAHRMSAGVCSFQICWSFVFRRDL